ncbi:MAG: hydantoinase/oxoprolinase family protein, partial [Solirubrobacterales bacterium]|nr:hydantoinase/oxoprolinase family protein [Solirubrobacterales bacterium]
MSTAQTSTQDAFIGVDVGGTHTDVSVVVGDRVERGKALTTYDDFSRGVLEAVAVAAGQFELSLADLLGRTKLFINGTTVVTNSIAQLRGSRVGVLVTSGFKDTFRFAGGPRLTEPDDHLQVNVPDLVARDAIAEIDERVDWSGAVIAPIDVEQVRAETRRLVEEVGVDAMAICFLSSFVNGAHELAAEAAIRELYPDLFVTPSHRVFPVLGETRRWTTAVLNSFVQENAEGYLQSLSGKLREAGLAGGLAFFQGLGGGISLEKA